jgi:hypothetical protein
VRTVCGVPSVATLTKAGPASRKGAGDEAPPGDKAREHVIRATTIDAHGLTCKHGGAPVAGGGALLCWGSRMTRKRQACAKEKPTCVIPNVQPQPQPQPQAARLSACSFARSFVTNR